MNTYVRAGLKAREWHIPQTRDSGTMWCGAELDCQHRIQTAMDFKSYCTHYAIAQQRNWVLCAECERRESERG